MWGDKKQETPQKKQEVPGRPTFQPKEDVIPTTPSFSGEAKTMAPLDSTYPAATNTGSTGTARLGATLHVKGEITGNEDLAIDGSVEGLVQLEDRKLTVGASARVTADVIAREVVVYGNVKGNLRARDRIEIKKDGSVVGDLTTARIMIEDGAYFKGSIEIDKGGDSSSSDSSSVDKSAWSKPSRTPSTITSSAD
jgi:cytoskeletal protein CcmA (bactofilin family)